MLNPDGDLRWHNVLRNNQFTIGGKITGFVLQHGEANDWAVGLGLADFGNRDPGRGPRRIRSRHRHRPHEYLRRCGYRRQHGCRWYVEWDVPPSTATHANNADPDGDAIKAQLAVVGEFNANFRDGTAAGGFGANKK